MPPPNLAAFSRAVEALSRALRLSPESEIKVLEKRLVQLSLRTTLPADDEGMLFADDLFAGFTPQSIQLLLIAAVSLVVWQHGRAFVRWCSILMLSGSITVWALFRRAKRSALAATTAATAAATPASSSAAATTHGSGSSSSSAPGPVVGRRVLLPPVSVEPSQLDAKLRECLHLHDENNETLKAYEILRSVEAALAELPASTSAARAAQRTLSAKNAALAEIRTRGALALEALHNIGQEEGWSEPIEAFGSRTRFRRAGSDGQLTLRVDGIIEDVPLADVLAVWREVALFPEWLPSCVSSTLLRTKGHADVLFHMGLSLLGVVSRDAVVHAYPVNALGEAGVIMLLARSVDADDMPGETRIPPLPSWPLARMEYKKLQIVLEPISATTTKASLIFNVDAKLKIVPQSFVQSILKRTLCLLFWHLKRTARKIGQGEGAHAAAVVADRAFYADWLLPRLKQHRESAPPVR